LVNITEIEAVLFTLILQYCCFKDAVVHSKFITATSTFLFRWHFLFLSGCSI